MCGKEVQDTIDCYLLYKEGGEESKCTKLVDVLEACTVKATHKPPQ